MRIGYARESKHGQPLFDQMDALNDCDTVFSDKAADSGDAQPKLKACLAILKEGDTLVVTRLERLASSTYFLTQVADKLNTLGVDLIVLDEDIDTREASDRIFFRVLSSVAQIEKEKLNAEVEGIEANQEARLSYDQIEEMQYRIACGGTVSELCDEYKISTETFFRLTE